MASLSYKKLWKLLIDRNLTKSELRLKAGISTTTLAKLSKGETIRTDILVRICTALDCDTSDIMEFDRTDADLSKLSGESKMVRSSANPAKDKRNKINGGQNNGR
jgi:DNA-binding Xre family transcriptional regulator